MKKLPNISYVNGKSETRISVSDRGLNYGDGLFETILYLNGTFILLEEHLDRLARDSRRLQINLELGVLNHELVVLSEAIKNAGILTGVVKIIVTRQFMGRGYAYVKNSPSNRLLQYYSGISYPIENLKGVRLSLCDYRLPANKQLAGIKHLNRLDQIMAHNSIKKPFYQEAILFGSGGEVVECVSSNIFSVKDDCLFTPDLGNAGVQGVMRDYIISGVAPRLRLKTVVKKIYTEDLLSADELFVCNSVFGVWPVIAIHVKEYAGGVITGTIQREINKLGYDTLYQ